MIIPLRHIKYILPAFSIFCNSVLFAYCNVEFPQIPERPSFPELKKSLKPLSTVNENDSKQSTVMIKSFSNGKMESNFSSKTYKNVMELFGNHDMSLEKDTRLSSVRLFSRTLTAIRTLNLSLKSFDTVRGEIIAVDNLHNTVVVSFFSGSKDTRVKVSGYASKFGHKLLNNTVTTLMKLISEEK